MSAKIFLALAVVLCVASPFAHAQFGFSPFGALGLGGLGGLPFGLGGMGMMGRLGRMGMMGRGLFGDDMFEGMRGGFFMDRR